MVQDQNGVNSLLNSTVPSSAFASSYWHASTVQLHGIRPAASLGGHGSPGAIHAVASRRSMPTRDEGSLEKDFESREHAPAVMMVTWSALTWSVGLWGFTNMADSLLTRIDPKEALHRTTSTTSSESSSPLYRSLRGYADITAKQTEVHNF